MGTIDQYQYTDFVKKVVFGFGLLIIILTPILVTFGKQMYLSSKNIFTDKNNRKAYCFAILFASFIVFSFFLMELFYLFGFWNFPEVIFKNANFAMFLTFMGPSLILFYNTAYSCYKIKTDTTDVLKTDGLNEAVKAISNSIFGFFSFSSCLLILAKIFVPNLNSETYKYRFISLPIVIFCEIFLIIIFYKLLTNLSQLDRKNNN